MVKRYIILLILLLSFTLVYLVRWTGNSGENYRGVIRSDGHGYYNYYPSLLPSLYNESIPINTFMVYDSNGKELNKYFCGTAVLWSPFVLPVYAYYEMFSDDDVNFYAKGFQMAISIAALFYLFFGLLFFKKLLLSFHLEQKVVGFTIFAFFFGTNLAYYTIIEPSMSHVYSFALITGFLYNVRMYSITQKPKYLLYTSILLSLVLLVRPINILILISVPIIWKHEVSIFKLLISQKKQLAVSILIGLTVISMQGLVWYIQTDHFIQWSYVDEGFYFSDPQIANFIFSFRKGFAIYTPILMLSLGLLFLVFKKNKSQALYFVLFVVTLLYILSSWWNWYYGDSYGSRVLIDFLSVFGLMFALGLGYSGYKVRLVLVSISLVFISLNIFQSYQYYHKIMSHFDMNSEKYTYVFLKYGEENENILGGVDDIAPYHKQPMELLSMYSTDSNDVHADVQIFQFVEPQLQMDSSMNGYHINRLDFPFGIDLQGTNYQGFEKLYIEMECKSFSKEDDLSDVLWAVSYYSLEGGNAQQYFRVNGVPISTNKWRTDKYRFSIPTPESIHDRIKISLWNKGQRDFFFRDMRVSIYGVNPK